MSKVTKEQYIQALRDMASGDDKLKDNARATLVAWHKQFKNDVEKTFGSINKINQRVKTNNSLINLIKKKGDSRG
jgi:ppGpp synthetase/RelA/SpoT-type nucleotidyltranferase